MALRGCMPCLFVSRPGIYFFSEKNQTYLGKIALQIPKKPIFLRKKISSKSVDMGIKRTGLISTFQICAFLDVGFKLWE